MCSSVLIRKSVLSRYLFPPFRIFFEYNLLKAFPASNLNLCIHTLSENQESEYKAQETRTNRRKESDDFGTLKRPLEKKKFKINSQADSVAREKRIIKVKRPITDESDVFGNLSEKKPLWYPDFSEEPKVDNNLHDDSVIVKNIGKKYQSPQKYLSEMKRLVDEKKVKDALNLFVEMRRNFVAPIHAHYTYMIGVCGRIGYTEMAFQLLRQMTDRALKPTPATLTGMFNACAESPFPEYGLKKARLLKEKIEMKNWPLTQVTYHAMIKAFGRCGDLTTAFEIVDQMTKADIKIDVSTYSFLLMSCISNKEAGFTYAVEVWRKMKAKKCKPNVFTCNLLLRATRDCGIGPEEISCLLLQHWSSYSKRPYGFITKEKLLKDQSILKLKSGKKDIVQDSFQRIQNNSNEFEENKNFNNNESPSYELLKVPDRTLATQNSPVLSTSLLSSRPIHGPEILEIVNIKTPSDRLSLIGGMDGFLKFLQESKIKPDMKTFSLLLECLPNNIEDEEKLLLILDNYHMKPSVDFFNALIKRRNFRKEIEAARNVLLLLNKYDLTPDVMTFGALALGCKTLQLASSFVSEMKKFGTHLNIEIAGSLVRQACVVLDFSYMKFVLKLMEEQAIKPDEKLLSTLEKTLSDVRKNIILMEHGKPVSTFYQRKNIQNDYKEFLNFYEDWLKRTQFKPEDHPWSQYKTDIIDKTREEEFKE